MASKSERDRNKKRTRERGSEESELTLRAANCICPFIFFICQLGLHWQRVQCHNYHSQRATSVRLVARLPLALLLPQRIAWFYCRWGWQDSNEQRPSRREKAVWQSLRLFRMPSRRSRLTIVTPTYVMHKQAHTHAHTRTYMTTHAHTHAHPRPHANMCVFMLFAWHCKKSIILLQISHRSTVLYVHMLYSARYRIEKCSRSV